MVDAGLKQFGGTDVVAHAEPLLAEDALERAGEEGLRVRHDIGTAKLLQSRIDYMQELRTDPQ